MKSLSLLPVHPFITLLSLHGVSSFTKVDINSGNVGESTVLEARKGISTFAEWAVGRDVKYVCRSMFVQSNFSYKKCSQL